MVVVWRLRGSYVFFEVSVYIFVCFRVCSDHFGFVLLVLLGLLFFSTRVNRLAGKNVSVSSVIKCYHLLSSVLLHLFGTETPFQ